MPSTETRSKACTKAHSKCSNTQPRIVSELAGFSLVRPERRRCQLLLCPVHCACRNDTTPGYPVNNRHGTYIVKADVPIDHTSVDEEIIYYKK